MYKKYKKMMALFVAVLIFFNIGLGVYAETIGPELKDEASESIESTSEIKKDIEELKPSLKLEVSLEDKPYKNGDTIEYEIKLQNDGQVNLENIKVKEDLNQEYFIKELKVKEENLTNRKYKIDANNKLDEIINKIEIEVNFEDRTLNYEGQFKLAVTKEEFTVEEVKEEEKIKEEPKQEDEKEEANQEEAKQNKTNEDEKKVKEETKEEV